MFLLLLLFIYADKIMQQFYSGDQDNQVLCMLQRGVMAERVKPI